ncbi:MAG: alpha/beta fold hydrolase [Betaproteobacteria bacterium]
MSDLESFDLETLNLQLGGSIPDAKLTYRTWGRLNRTRDNCIIFPTYYTGNHESNARIIGKGCALDPDDWFIVVPNLFGNGTSTSPSNTPGSSGSGNFPRTTILDNVLSQHRLVMERLGVRRIALAIGWSMGAMQAFQWAALFPAVVDRLLPICGTARCWPHNFVFLEGVKAALKADPSFKEGFYDSPPERGLRAFGRAYAGWAYSAAFFRESLYRALGFNDLEEFLIGWEEDHLKCDANDLLAMLHTWQSADISANSLFGGNIEYALSTIRARTIVMPCNEDLYFILEESKLETAMIPGAEFRPIFSPFGHCAGAPGRFPVESRFVDDAIRELLAR